MSTQADTTNTDEQTLALEAAGAELMRDYAKIKSAGPFFHQRTHTAVLSISVTEWSVMNEVPLTDGKYKGFKVVWGFYVPDDKALL